MNIGRPLSLPVAWRWLITVAFATLITALSVVPGERQYGDSSFVWLVESTPPLIQNVMHLVFYAGMTLLLAWSLANLYTRRTRLTLALIVTLALGTVLEWYQTMVPGRFGTLFDAGLNGIGAAVGLLAALLLLEDS